jgi:hypothetical protein
MMRRSHFALELTASMAWPIGVVAAAGLATALLATTTASAQPTGGVHPSSPPPRLAPVPNLRLTLPPPVLGPGTGLGPPLHSESTPAPWLTYWMTTHATAAWRGFSDGELRMNIETGRWELGPLILSTQITSTPESERDCHPDCRGPAWSSSLRLKYDMGNVGPLQHVGPELEVGVTPAEPRTPAKSLLRGGFSGQF